MGKYMNLLRISFSYLVSTLSGCEWVWGMPVSLGIELTNHCNLKCPHCASGAGIADRKKGYMSKELFLRISDQLKGNIFTTMLYFQGESMMHPQFFEFLELAQEMNPVISTNGHYLDSESCQKLANIHRGKIIVSLDGISEHSYNAYRRGGNVEKVLRGIENLAEAIHSSKSRSRLQIQVLVNSYNENEIDTIKKFALKLRAGLSLKSMQLIDNDDKEGFLPRDSKFRRYSNKDGILKIKGKGRGACFRLWTNPVISWDGKVLPCCFDKNALYSMGDLNKQSFREIWKGEVYSLFRTNILHNRAGIDICSNCTKGLPLKIRR